MIYSLNKLMEREKFQFDNRDSGHWNNSFMNNLKKCGYLMDNENREMICDIIPKLTVAGCWISRSPEPGKNYITPPALLIYGNSGAGKTFLMKIYSAMFRISLIKAKIVDTEESYKTDAFQLIRSYDDQHLIIDDLGAETNTEKLKTIIDHRYDRWEKGYLTYYTTNFASPDQIEKTYGTRIKTRILEQCNRAKLAGRNRRPNQ